LLSTHIRIKEWEGVASTSPPGERNESSPSPPRTHVGGPDTHFFRQFGETPFEGKNAGTSSPLTDGGGKLILL